MALVRHQQTLKNLLAPDAKIASSHVVHQDWHDKLFGAVKDDVALLRQQRRGQYNVDPTIGKRCTEGISFFEHDLDFGV